MTTCSRRIAHGNASATLTAKSREQIKGKSHNRVGALAQGQRVIRALRTCEYWHQGAYMTTTVLLSRWPSSRDARSSCESCCTLLSLSQRSRMASCCACSAALATTLPECSPHSLPVASSHHHLPSLSC